MTTVGAIASVLLGVTFLIAGGSKLAAGDAWPVQARALGAPAVVAPILPWLELAVGATLGVGVARPLPAVVALVLLVAFSVAIARRLREGRHPVCACFGAWSATPIGAGHLWRNAALMVPGVLALFA